MITVEHDDRGQIHDIKIQGHARYAKAGKDIVCAGASTLAFTLAEALEKIDDAAVKLSYDGDMLRIVAVKCPKGDLVIDTIMNGYSLLEENYPKNIEVI